MSKQLIGAGILMVLGLAACQGEATGPAADQLSARREAEARGPGGRRIDDTLAVHPAKGRNGDVTVGDDRNGGVNPEPGDDRGRGRGKQNDDTQPHP